MEICVVIASINELTNVNAFKSMLANDDYKVIIIDEGDEKIRRKNKALLSSISHVFYGPKETTKWFKQHFGSKYQKYLSIIPEKCHAETSFGFLVSYEEQPEFVIEIDDDVFPLQGHGLVRSHANNLINANGETVHSKGRWYNTMENLKLNTDIQIFPRGHPYAQETRNENYVWDDVEGKCVLNMGLWAGHPDLDALTILYHGGLDGRCKIESKGCKRNKIIVGEGTYFPICSMNISFLPEIIPAFYQLYMNFIGVDRFDDIWSGIFFKKIADHLRCKVCVGEPLVYHDKRLRNVFKDLEKELGGMAINEVVWKIVDSLELDGKTYWDSYNSLINGLERDIVRLQNGLHQKFMLTQIEKMRLWLKVIDKMG